MSEKKKKKQKKNRAKWSLAADIFINTLTIMWIWIFLSGSWHHCIQCRSVQYNVPCTYICTKAAIATAILRIYFYIPICFVFFFFQQRDDYFLLCAISLFLRLSGHLCCNVRCFSFITKKDIALLCERLVWKITCKKSKISMENSIKKDR